MGVAKEVGLKVEDFLGVNRQQTDEDLPDGYFKTAQNLYEKKLGELHPRGGSVAFPNQPSNINAMYSNYTLYDKALGKTKLLKAGCAAASTGYGATITKAQVTMSFVTDVANGKWGGSPVGLVASSGFVGCKSIVLVATGFGVNCQLNTPLTAGLPVAGDTKKLQVVISSPLADNNITGIEVYAEVTTQWYLGGALTQFIYVGHIDLILTPTGTFPFYCGPLHMASDPGATVQDVGGSDATFNLTASISGGGAFLPGKTYYVAMMSHRVYFDSANTVNTRNRWLAQSIKSITIPNGFDSIQVQKTGGGSAATLLAIGLHPQLLKPMFIISNSATFTQTFSQLPHETMWGCCAYLPNSNTINQGLYMFRGSDVSSTELFAKIDSGGNWIPLPVNNYAGYNQDQQDQYHDLPWYTPSYNILSLSSNSDFNAVQYFSQTQEMLYLTPTGNVSGSNYNEIAGLVAPILVTCNTTSGSANIARSSMSSTDNLTADMLVVGPGIPNDTTIVNPNSAGSLVLSNACTATQTGVEIELYPGVQIQFVPSHSLVHTDGKAVSMAVMDFGKASPPPFTLLSVYKEHLVGSGGTSDARNKLYFANAFNPYDWSVPGLPSIAQYIQVASTGEDVSALTEYTNSANLTGPVQQFTVGKKNALFVLTDFPTYSSSGYNNAALIQLSKKAGVANSRCLVYTELGTIAVGSDNVWLIRGTGEPTPLGDEIAYFLRSDDPNQSVDVTNWTASYHNNYLKLAFSAPGSSTPNQELWLDINKTKKLQGKPVWWGPMTGREIWQSNIEERFNDTIIPKRLCVDRTNLRWYQADKEDIRQDFGSNLTYVLDGKVLGMQDDMTNKLLVELYWKLKVDANLTFSESVTALNDSGTTVDTNNRTCNIVPGYVAVDYANFVSLCRAKLYRFFPVNRGVRGENFKVKWTYTGNIMFTIAGFGAFYLPERRRPGL